MNKYKVLVLGNQSFRDPGRIDLLFVPDSGFDRLALAVLGEVQQ